MHLAGAGIGDKRWTDDYKRELLESRTKGTTLISEAIAVRRRRPDGAAVGLGDRHLRRPRRRGTRRDVGARRRIPRRHLRAVGAGHRAWPKRPAPGSCTCAPASCCRPRAAPSRSSCRCSSSASAARWAAATSGRAGSRSTTRSPRSPTCSPPTRRGAVNLTAPKPVTNAEFTDTLGEVLHRPTFLPIPKFGPKLLLGGELADNLLFSGQKVLPARPRGRRRLHVPAPRPRHGAASAARQVSTPPGPTNRSPSSVPASPDCRAPLRSTRQASRCRCSRRATASVAGCARDHVDGFTLDRGFQVALTAYPEMHRQLDMAALDLQAFDPGALVWRNGHGPSSAIRSDDPSTTLSTATAPIGSRVRQGPHRAAASPAPQRPPGPAAPGRRRIRPGTRSPTPGSPTRSSSASSARWSAASSSIPNSPTAAACSTSSSGCSPTATPRCRPPGCRRSPTSSPTELPAGTHPPRRTGDVDLGDVGHARRRRRDRAPPRSSSPPRARRRPGCSASPDVESKSVGAVYFAAPEAPIDVEARRARRHRARPRAERRGDEQRGAHLRTRRAATSSSQRSPATSATTIEARCPRAAPRLVGSRRSTRGTTFATYRIAHGQPRQRAAVRSQAARAARRRPIRVRRPPRHRLDPGGDVLRAVAVRSGQSRPRSVRLVTMADGTPTNARTDLERRDEVVRGIRFVPPSRRRSSTCSPTRRSMR